MEVAADGEGAFLVAGVDESVEPFGGVVADGQHADVVDHDQVDAGELADGFGDGVVGAVPADQGAEFLDVNQATVRPVSMASWPSASQEWLLPVPDGPHTQRFSCRSTHSRVRSACWVGRGWGSGFRPHVEGLADREVRLPAAHPQGGVVAAGSPRSAARAAARRDPALRAGGGHHVQWGSAQVGQAEPAGKRDDVVQRLGGRSVTAGPTDTDGSRRWHRSPAGGPNPAQPKVPGCRLCASSPGRCGTAGPLLLMVRIAARSVSLNRPATAARRGLIDRGGAGQLGGRHRFAHLDRTRDAPAAAASTNHAFAPSPMARNAASAEFAAAASAPWQRRRPGCAAGWCSSRICGRPRCPEVPGDLPRPVGVDDADHQLVPAHRTHTRSSTCWCGTE